MAAPHRAPSPTRSDQRPAKFETASETYVFRKQLGEGGSGFVFEVADSSGKIFALKCLKPEGAKNGKRKRFKNELRFSKGNHHRNLIQIVDEGAVTWREQVVPFYVMPFMTQTLRNLLDCGLSVEKRLPFFNQILDGTEAAHFLGVVHRDLKPENILYDPKEDRIVVADFGIAQFSDEHMATFHQTKFGELLGARNYLAPEQRIPGSTVDQRADIFALGLILNEMFTGGVPYGHNYPTIGLVDSSFEYLDQIIQRMTQHDPGARYGDLGAVKNELIARGNEFVIRQRIETKNREVVPAQFAERAQPIEIIGLDWERGTLIIQLNRKPEEPWKGHFLNASLGGRTVMHGLVPRAYGFSESTARVGVNENTRHDAISQFKLYAGLATEAYQARLDGEARLLEESSRAQLLREVREDEIRLKMLKDLNF